MRTISQDVPGWYVVAYALAIAAAIALGLYLDHRDNAKADAESWRRYLAGTGGQR